MRIGFLGVGTISTAVIRAMCARPGNADSFVLSPRSESLSRELAREYACCQGAASNQEVVDSSDMVVLAMRPQQVDEALGDLRFRDDQLIASFIAGSPPSQIAELVAPAHRIAQLIPLPPIELHRGPLLICPGIPEVAEAFAGLGEVIVLDDESLVRVFSCVSAFMSTYYEMQNTLIDWAVSRGIDRETASRYVVAELDGLATVGMRTPTERLDELPGEFQTKGGLNERVRGRLLTEGWFAALRNAVDDTYANAVLRPPAE